MHVVHLVHYLTFHSISLNNICISFFLCQMRKWSVISNSVCLTLSQQWYWATSKTWHQCRICFVCLYTTIIVEWLTCLLKSCVSFLSVYSATNVMFCVCQSGLYDMWINCDQMSKGLLYNCPFSLWLATCTWLLKLILPQLLNKFCIFCKP